MPEMFTFGKDFSGKLIRKTAWFILFIFAINYVAMKFFWYSTIWWFDMPMHFLGGFWVSLLALSLCFRNQKDPINENSFRIILVSLVITFAIGLLWELFEIGIDKLITFSSFNILDTVSDIFFDLGGAFAGVFYVLKKYSI